MSLCESLHQSSAFVHILMILFGMRAWVDLTGVWVEMPIIVDSLPEGWTMGSLITLSTQFGNLILIFYIIGNVLIPKVINDTSAITVIYIVGGMACTLLIFFWDSTTLLFDSPHSTALLVLTFFMGGLNCLTSVVFITFVSSFKKQYVASMFVGFGFGSLFPSLAALIQGVGNTVCVNSSSFSTQDNISAIIRLEPNYLPPRFSLPYFFVLILGLEAVSFVSFLILRFSKKCQREKNPPRSIEILPLPEKQFVADDNKLQTAEEDTVNKSSISLQEEGVDGRTCRVDLVLLLFLVCWLNGLWNGLLRSIQSYASLPYGTETFHLGTTLSNSSSPLAGFCAMFIPTNSKRVLWCLGGITTTVFVYVMVLVCLSPTPPLQNHVMGSVLSITSQACIFGFVSYIRSCAAGICHTRGRRAGLWLGVALQLGSFLGAAIAYICVNVLFLFNDAQPCLVSLYMDT